MRCAAPRPLPPATPPGGASPGRFPAAVPDGRAEPSEPSPELPVSNGAPVSLPATVTLGRRHPRGPLHPHPSGLLPLLVSNLCPLFGQHASLEPTSYPFFFLSFSAQTFSRTARLLPPVTMALGGSMWLWAFCLLLTGFFPLDAQKLDRLGFPWTHQNGEWGRRSLHITRALERSNQGRRKPDVSNSPRRAEQAPFLVS